MAAPRLLLAACDVPGWGGASTVTYGLFERLQAAGHAVALVNLVEAADAPRLAADFGPAIGNPRGLADVHTCLLPAPLWQAHAGLGALVERLRPDVLVTRGYIATWLMRRVAPRLPQVFLTSGVAQVKRLLADGTIDDFADFVRLVGRGVVFPVPPRDREAQAVAESDLVILHSPHVRAAYEHFFPAYLGAVYERLVSVADEIYAAAAPFTGLARPFAARDIDVLFVASDWSRAEKNVALVRSLAVACRGLRVHLVGRADAAGLPLTHHGVVADRADLYALLGRTRALVCPSRFDAAPGVLFEASAMGCNVVASPNCGNWQLCPAPFVARRSADFPACIARAVAAPLPDHRERFRGGYADLVETLLAFAG
jgi:glycosyltransferase involved in cell wall biosynthesis